MNMNGCSQGFPVMQANFQNQSYGPSFYQNYSGHFFNPTSQPVPSSQPWVNPSANMPGMRTEGYNQGLSELSKYSKTTCNGYKLNKHYNLYDHYETYIPSFQYWKSFSDISYLIYYYKWMKMKSIYHNFLTLTYFLPSLNGGGVRVNKESIPGLVGLKAMES